MPEPDASRQTYRFREFELDVAAYELRRKGLPVRLERQPMDLLILLVERRQQLVQRSEIIQRLWGPDVFIDVETGVNTAVRKIRQVLGDPSDAPAFIETVPGKGYRFVAPVQMSGNGARRAVAADGHADVNGAASKVQPPTPPLSATHQPANVWRRHWGRIAAAILAALLSPIAVWWLRRPEPVPAPAMRVLGLTAMNGSELGSSFSPDARQVAFAWNGEPQDNFDVYVKLTGSSEVRRLTTDAAPDLAPQWSPDGRQIAYVRASPPWTSQRIRVMSALGGSDRQVTDFPIWLPAVWSPDSRYLFAGRASPGVGPSANGLYIIPVQGGEPRVLTRPDPPTVDQGPALTLDGRELAFMRCDASRIQCEVEVLDLDDRYNPVGRPRKLTTQLRMPRGVVTWTRDGAFVIFGAEDTGLNYLWRVSAKGRMPPERIELAGVNALFPTTTPAADRLAFTRTVEDQDIYRFTAHGAAAPVARSPVFDGNPSFSPDGGRIAFCSLRSGDAMDVWVANADGANPRQLTHGPGRWQCSPSWSPDGTRIAFDSQAEDGHWHVWTVDLEGGTSRQITADPGDQNMPTWSHDGESLYYSWKQGDEREIWRRLGRTGRKERVTQGGSALVGRESADGRLLLYQPRRSPAPLLAQPLGGGPVHTLADCVVGTAFAITATTVFYVPCSTDGKVDPDPPVRVVDLITRATHEVGRLAHYQWDEYPSGFAVAPDAQSILYSRLVGSGADLMMIEHFR